MINYFAFGILAVLIYIFVWSIIDRICKCFEKCSYTKAMGKYLTSNECSKKFFDLIDSRTDDGK